MKHLLTLTALCAALFAGCGSDANPQLDGAQTIVDGGADLADLSPSCPHVDLAAYPSNQHQLCGGPDMSFSFAMCACVGDP